MKFNLSKPGRKKREKEPKRRKLSAGKKERLQLAYPATSAAAGEIEMAGIEGGKGREGTGGTRETLEKSGWPEGGSMTHREGRADQKGMREKRLERRCRKGAHYGETDKRKKKIGGGGGHQKRDKKKSFGHL